MQIGKEVSEAILKHYESDTFLFRGFPGSYNIEGNKVTHKIEVSWN